MRIFTLRAESTADDMQMKGDFAEIVFFLWNTAVNLDNKKQKFRFQTCFHARVYEEEFYEGYLMTKLEPMVYFKTNMVECLDSAKIFKALAFLTARSQIHPTAEQRQALDSFVKGQDMFVSLPMGQTFFWWSDNLSWMQWLAH